jgi:N-acetylglucosamine-6-phosphate deacetylase
VQTYILSGAKICLPDTIINDHYLIVNNGIITHINQEDTPKPDHIEIIKLSSNHTIIPGFIDVHIHGANGSDVMDATPESLHNIATTISKQGVTNFLATTMTASDSETSQALKNVALYNQTQNNSGAKICGVHLEGPFLSEAKIGAQNSKFLANPNIKLFSKWIEKSDSLIKKVTIAPELSHADPLIKYMLNNKIIPSIGHTNCTAKQAQSCINLGATSATHLFNAMSGVSHRKPGAATAILLDDRVYSELIVDGVHLSPEIIQLVFKVKGCDKIILVTDAMSAQSYGDGQFMLGGQKVIVSGNEARLENGALAGSVLTMNKAVKNMLSTTECSLPDAIKMATLTPAKNIGLDHIIGSISVGKRADLAIIDDKFNISHTFISYHEKSTDNYASRKSL